MRTEKQSISQEYVARLNASPFFIVVEYTGLKVGPITELRKRLVKAGAEMHVVKNSLFRLAAKDAGLGEFNGALAGQLAVVTGQKDVSAAAKTVKTFQKEFEKPKIKFGYLNNQRLEGYFIHRGSSFTGGPSGETGRIDQYAGHAAGADNPNTRHSARARVEGESRERLIKHFPA